MTSSVLPIVPVSYTHLDVYKRQIQSLCEKVVVYEKFLGVVSAVIDPYLPKRHITKDYIKMVVWEICFLKALNGNVRFLVELLCNPCLLYTSRCV